jgi:15-cis-phytoene synthase
MGTATMREGDAARADDTPQRRGTPPGSLRYFSVLFAEPGTRATLHALYALEAELRDTAASPNHDIAHTRLAWWREELALLADGRPRHPVAVELAPAVAQRRDLMELLHEMTVAAELDLARFTYTDWPELDAYCRRAAGALQEAIAGASAAPEPLTDAERRFARRLGSAVRQTEMLRDVAHDLRHGLLYVPVDAITEAGLDPRTVPGQPTHPALLRVLAAWKTRVAAELAVLPALLDRPQRRRQRHGLVLGALHHRLLSDIGRAGTDESVRVEVPPFARLWTAWRAAITSH